MTDPRFTDTRNDPVLSDEGVGGSWGWIAGLAVLALIAFVLIAGWNSNPNAASNGSAPITTGSAPMSPLSSARTSGSGTTSPSPMAPAPAPSSSDQK